MTRQVYLDELDKLHKKVIEMGTLIEGSLDQVEEALYKMNRKKAREIINGDDRVDAMEREIERDCIDMIAKQQPVATDLRRVTSIMLHHLRSGTDRRPLQRHFRIHSSAL